MPRQEKKSVKGTAKLAPTGSQKKKRARKSPATVKWVAIFMFVVVILAVANYDLFGGNDGAMIYKGVSIGPVAAAGLTPAEAAGDLEKYLSGYRLTFVTPQGTESIGPFNETNQDIVEFQIKTAVDTAYGIGRHGNKLVAAAQRAGAALLGATVPVPFELSEERLLSELESRFGSLVSPTEDAQLNIKVNDGGDYEVSITPERAGMTFDKKTLGEMTRNRLRSLSSSAISVDVSIDLPELTEKKLEPLVERVGEIIERSPQNVTARTLSWTISRSQLADWVVPMLNDKGDWIVALDHDRMTKHLETYASSIAMEPQNALFEMNEETGKVSAFEPSIDGEKLDVEVSIGLLEKAFLDGETPDGSIDLPITVAYPEITTESSNKFGIKDLIGIGETNFGGSPANRRHNIATGASTLHGILIPPGEEFSLVGTLGDIDGEHGYLQELVIKQNETKAEYGGGLCQIGTTAFRVVMASGLPVTERRNHSYRVSYYERDGDGNNIGPGKDATIYDPWPDFKFKNDTKGHILIQTNISGDRLSFYFWGTDDGRKAEEGEVTVWNINPPPPKKEIFTTDLTPGTYRCTEHPHPSASTVFDYTVTYPDGNVVEEKFYSYYKPWQEVCEVGVTAEELAQKNAETAGGDTTETADDTETIPAADSSGMVEAEG